MKSTNDILSIVREGGNVIVNSSKSTTDLLNIIRAMGENNQLIIKGANSKSTTDLLSMTRAADGKKVIFDLT